MTLRASGRLGDEEIACSVETGRALVEAGLHPATGGSGVLACSGDMLLHALVSCAGVTLRAAATALGFDVAGTVVAEGDLDFTGHSAPRRTRTFRSASHAVRLRFDLEHSLSPDELATLLRLTERYCVVYQTLVGGVPVEVTAAP